MTLEEIKASKKVFLSPRDVAPVIGCNPYSINCACRNGKQDKLGFPVLYMNTRVRIPRKEFLKFIGE